VWARDVALLIVLARAAPLSAAQAAPEDAGDPATVHFDRGAALAAEQKYQEAAREFRASFELAGRKEALFAWAQVARLGGDCATALELYAKFLRSPDLTAAQSEAAQLGIARCQSAAPPLPPTPPPTSRAAPANGAAGPVVTSAPALTPPRSRRSVVLGASLLGGAVVALSAAGTSFVLARNDERAALAADIWGDYRKSADRARTRQRWGFGLLGAGVLLGGAAVVEWLATAPTPIKGTAATAWIGGGGAGVCLRGRY
jgi:hypothetical protein